MKAYINEHQLHQIFCYIQEEYDAFATQKKDGKYIFDALSNISDIPIPSPKTIIPFKKILWPNHTSVNESKARRKIALVGLTNCDALALELLLQELGHTQLLPEGEDLLVVSTECFPDKDCFCTALGQDKVEAFDIHIQKENKGFAIFSGTKLGTEILKKNGIKITLKQPKIKPVTHAKKEPLDQNELSTAVNDRANMTDFWQSVANNCFGCGSCSAVCPLCFCTRQDFQNEIDGSCHQCLSWDACFSKSFSEIQNHYDFRPANVDRLYNWYHHKFVRAYTTQKHFLCTGCGRCIHACPAHLNQYNIMRSLTRKEGKIDG